MKAAVDGSLKQANTDPSQQAYGYNDTDVWICRNCGLFLRELINNVPIR